MRENEIECLRQVRDAYFRGLGLKKEFDNSNYSVMESILTSAHHNEKHNDFPDFLFDGGIMEHFEVSASIESEKGSKFRIDEASNKRETEKYFAQLDEEFKNSERQPGTFFVESKKDVYQNFTYEAFVASFRKNVEKHLQSLEKCSLSNKAGYVVFLIEQKAGKLGVYVNGIFNRFYRISEDKKILRYTKEKMINVNFIIYKTIDSYEILDLSKIDEVIFKSKDNLDIRGGQHINETIKLYCDN